MRGTKHTLAIIDWTIDGIFEAFQKASIWKSAIGFEIGALLVCDSHASESHVNLILKVLKFQIQWHFSQSMLSEKLQKCHL